jgi:hypothetical protein
MVYKSEETRFLLHHRRPVTLEFAGYCSSWFCRLRAAFDVLRGNADALYWGGER